MRAIATLTISVASVLLISGCSTRKHDPLPPSNYSKIQDLDNLTVYRNSSVPVHYENQKNILQIEKVLSYQKEGEFLGKKYQSFKSLHTYDCTVKNKYTVKIYGFYADKYASGKPLMPFLAAPTRWKLAEPGSKYEESWVSMCVTYKAVLDLMKNI